MMHFKINGKIKACRASVKSMKEGDNLEDLDLDGMVVLKPILRQ
jgi:hypothetical protein